MFTTNRSVLRTSPVLAFSGGSINFAECSKVLGVTLDNKLNFRDHIRNVAKRVSKAAYGIRVIARNTSRPTIFAAYYGIVYPIIRYCIIIWGASTEAESVFILQKKILRIMLHLSYGHTCRGLFRKHSVLTVCGVYIFECVMFVRRHQSQFAGSRSVHGYSTRHAADFVYPNHRYTVTEKLPYYSMLKLYNRLPAGIKSIYPDNRFRTEVFKFICNIEPYTIGEFF